MGKKYGMLIGLTAVLLVVVIVTAGALWGLLSRQKQTQQEADAKAAAYDAAAALFEAGEYEDAIRAFAQLGDYKDSVEQIGKIQEARREAARQREFDAALEALREGNVPQGKAMLEAMGEDPQAQAILKQIRYLPMGVSMRYDGISMEARSLTYTYNADGTVHSARYCSGEEAPEDTLVGVYEDGRLVRLASDTRALIYTYDGSGNLTRIRYESASGRRFEDFAFVLPTGAFTWSDGDTIEFAYDTAGNRTGCVCKLASEILGDFTESYQLDSEGRILAATRTYEKVAEEYRYVYEGGRLSQVVQSAGDDTETVQRYDYDDAGNVRCIHLTLGLGIDYVYAYGWVYLQ